MKKSATIATKKPTQVNVNLKKSTNPKAKNFSANSLMRSLSPFPNHT